MKLGMAKVKVDRGGEKKSQHDRRNGRHAGDD
jgi:hypothetical protein